MVTAGPCPVLLVIVQATGPARPPSGRIGPLVPVGTLVHWPHLLLGLPLGAAGSRLASPVPLAGHGPQGTWPLPLTVEKCTTLSPGPPRLPLGLAEPSPGEGQSAEGPGP